MSDDNRLRTGSLLMLVAAVAFVGYGAVFAIMNFTAAGFELGVSDLGGVERAELTDEVSYYIGHLHVATAGFIMATGVAVGGLSWYGVRAGQMWAWTTAVGAAVLGLAVALPMHYTGGFTHDWIMHLGPIYLATLIFVVGALMALGVIRGGEAKATPAS